MPYASLKQPTFVFAWKKLVNCLAMSADCVTE
jgi:hypothetical protein